MASIKYYDVVNKLIEKTEKKEVNWLKVREDDFKVVLNSGAITISKVWSPNTNNYYFNLRIYNLQGDAIFERTVSEKLSISNPTNEIPYATLDRLFTGAKTSYFKVDETVDDIIDELTKNKEIGAKDDPSKDDLPF